MTPKPKIAIIGTGISGLACAYFLKDDFELTLFEKDDRVGGHSNTVVVPENGKELPLDTGFMVYNEVTYPHLTRLFEELDVETKPTEMSFSVQHLVAGLEFNGGSLNLLFAQRKNLLRPAFWKMLLQINRFNKDTVRELENPAFEGLTLSDYVAVRGYGPEFLEWYLSPMAAAVWSSPPERIDSFPAHTLMRFWHNHGFLGLDTQHPWRTVCGGSREYVKKLTSTFSSKIRSSAAVRAVANKTVILENGSKEDFDKIIFASHADQSLRMLASATLIEDEILGKFQFQRNQAVVHSDKRFMPATRRAWASWNYRIGADCGHSTHYWMNNLQGISKNRDYFVSINPPDDAPLESIHHQLEYEHPLFDTGAIEAQARIHELHSTGQRTGRYYCGAWQRYGFHEDGIWSAHRLCEFILKRDPWNPVAQTAS